MSRLTSLFLLLFSGLLYAGTIRIVAAENFYGDISKQIGGDQVIVTNILSNPNQDPHLFSSSPSTAKAIANADLIISNGIGYDAWIQTLLPANQHKPKRLIVADLLGKKMGDNPHIWYSPATMFVYAQELVRIFTQLDPEKTAYYQQKLNQFNHKHFALTQHIARLKQQYGGIAVIATEPVFNEMADALGFKMYGQNFQLSIMNETEPSITDMHDFEKQLTERAVKILFYNNQVTNPVTESMKDLAKQQHIPIVGVSETQPIQKDYWQWMEDALNELESALKRT